ncbi:MAG: response regulator [Nitrospiraceae bacterium]|jgi:two-component system chemotaxis response regulator CheY|nr:MAG: response regulator [Nitrospiraceae bacterium]
MAKKKILIVDDSVQTRKSLKDILLKNNYHIVGEAKNGTEAIKLIHNLSPDIVMLDIRMPQMGGIETLRMLRNINQNLKIIMVSAIDSIDKVKEYMKAGANHYILKPFEEAKVIEIITKVTGS